jgi:hypothetical protein
LNALLFALEMSLHALFLLFETLPSGCIPIKYSQPSQDHGESEESRNDQNPSGPLIEPGERQRANEHNMPCAEPVFKAETATGQKYYSDSRMQYKDVRLLGLAGFNKPFLS